jgi:hypothetical protein
VRRSATSRPSSSPEIARYEYISSTDGIDLLDWEGGQLSCSPAGYLHMALAPHASPAPRAVTGLDLVEATEQPYIRNTRRLVDPNGRDRKSAPSRRHSGC